MLRKAGVRRMEIFLDTAILDELKAGFATGVVDGITTNPSLMRKAAAAMGKGMTVGRYIGEILRIAGRHPVSLEVAGGTAEEMYAQGKALYARFAKKANHVVIKIPVNPTVKEDLDLEGLKAVRKLAKEKIPVNVTLVFTPEQALLAAKAGAAYVSPFAGRIDDLIRKREGKGFGKSDYFPAEGAGADDNGIVSGIDLVAQIVAVFRNYGIKAKVLAASLRNARQVREAALAGADIATVPFAVLQEMLRHEKTREGMAAFTKDLVPEYVALMGRKGKSR